MRSMRSVMTLVAAALVLAGLTAFWGPAPFAQADTFAAANKVGISASNIHWMNQNQTPGTSTTDTYEIAKAKLKTSSPMDLVIQVNAETGLYTAVGAKGTLDTLGKPIPTSSTANAQVIVWVELDGKMLPVTMQKDPTDPGDVNLTDNLWQELNGPVAFNSRAFNLSTKNLPLDQAIALFIKTRSANSFQWFALNVGNGSHEVVAKARLVSATFQSGGAPDALDFDYVTPEASALVGQRTMTVEPQHMMNSASY